MPWWQKGPPAAQGDCEGPIMAIDLQLANLATKIQKLEPKVPTHVRIKQWSDKKDTKQKQLQKVKGQVGFVQAKLK